MYVLKLCVGMFLGICGHTNYSVFPDYASCDRERQQQVARVGKGYALGTPAPPKLRSEQKEVLL